jgi:hypothetical protein
MSHVKSFKDFCETFRELSYSGKAPEEMVIEGQMILSDYLANNPDLILDHLVGVTENRSDDEFLPIDVNEISIYREPNRMFSVRVFVPGAPLQSGYLLPGRRGPPSPHRPP